MELQKHIEEFSLTLISILESEIKLGNEINESSKGFPNEESIIIFLKRPFIGEYKLENVEYRSIDDIHYWKAEYFDKLTNHVLVCNF